MNQQELISSALVYASTTKLISSEPGCLHMLPSSLAQHFPEHTFFLVADEHTWNAAGIQVETLLESANLTVEEKYVFPGTPILEADHGYALQIAQKLRRFKNAIPIAIGGGTINDLVKLGSHISNRPYVCVATACSVDGYASDGAALLTNGAKMTHPCPAPTIIIGDPFIMEKAPGILQASGYADLMAKITAGADWILADFLGEHQIDTVCWSLIQDNLKSWLVDPHDSSAIFTGLTLCGIAMQYMKDSRPVSGTEHLLSHVWEMEHVLYDNVAPLHGIKVGIGTLLTTGVYELLISQGIEGGVELESLEHTIELKYSMVERYFSEIFDVQPLKAIIKAKYNQQNRRETRRKVLIERWPDLALLLKQQIIPYGEIVSLLKKAGCPVVPEKIGLTTNQTYETLRKAQLIRNRYTIIDALDDLGIMDWTIKILNCFA
jgi:glycerol-1-phosphate dehydrogenase [NAD(P)+]